MDKVFSIAGLAVIMSAISLLPQVISVFQTKSVLGISPSFLAMDAVGSILWIIYGRRINDRATIISSSVSLLLISSLLLAFYFFRETGLDQRKQKYIEDDRFQFGGPMSTRGEPPLSIPGNLPFAGADSYSQRPPELRSTRQPNGSTSSPNQLQDDPNWGGGLFGGPMVSSSLDFSNG